MNELKYSGILFVLIMIVMILLSWYDIYFTLGQILQTFTAGIITLVVYTIVVLVDKLVEIYKQ